jgi:hypothetical protein
MLSHLRLQAALLATYRRHPHRRQPTPIALSNFETLTSDEKSLRRFTPPSG